MSKTERRTEPAATMYSQEDGDRSRAFHSAQRAVEMSKTDPEMESGARRRNMDQQPRARIRRLYVPNVIYFITTVTHGRELVFAEKGNIKILRETVRRVKEKYPFGMRAFVFLPDHFHLLIQVFPHSSISQIMHSVKRNVTLNLKKVYSISKSTRLWQRGFWDHVMRDERDYVNHFHYIHYNPVKHGYVSKPENWPHSSFHTYLSEGWYETGWGHTEPQYLKELNFE